MATYELTASIPTSTSRQTAAVATTSTATAVRSHLPWAVLATLLCFAPTGVVAVVYAARVQPLLAAGREDEARHAAKLAARFAFASVAMTALFVAILVAQVDGYVPGPGGQ